MAGDFEDIAIGEPVSARQLLGIIREVEKALLRIGTDVDALHYLAGRAEPKVFEEIEVAAGGSLHGGDGLALLLGGLGIPRHVTGAGRR